LFNEIYRDKSILVTGHTGFKGSWLSQWLVELGARVTGISIDIPTKPSHFVAIKLKKKMNHIFVDIRNFKDLKEIFEQIQPDMVFHLAAEAIVRKSYDDPRSTFGTNVLGTVNVLECINQTPSVKAGIIITSDKCYENKGVDYSYCENDKLGGSDPYSASKACAEIVSTSYIRSFFSNNSIQRVATARAGNVIGGGDWSTDRLVPDCIKAWSKKESPLIRNPNSVRPWQHVLEPLSGYLWLGAKLINQPEKTHGEAFNFGPINNVNKSVSLVLKKMKKNWSNVSWKKDASDQGIKKEAALLNLNCNKARRRLGWQSILSLENSIRMTIEWYKQFYQNKSNISEITKKQIHTYERIGKKRNQRWAN